MRKIQLIILVLFILCKSSYCQSTFTFADTLRGTISSLRSCYDVTFYDLAVTFDLQKQTIAGSNVITYQVVNEFDSMQIDLFPQLTIDSIIYKKSKLTYRRLFESVFIKMNSHQLANENNEIKIYYHGRPIPAHKAPWEGGFNWKRDVSGKPWISVSCQGTGASCWWPCKDHQSDEPDSMRMNFTIPSDLKCISNGKIQDVIDNSNNTSTWIWKVHYPINTYLVTFNIADYAYFSDYYINDKDTLLLEYYVFKNNLAQAKNQFKQVNVMLACYEKYFGKYPFLKDSYKLVETSYWGMEHQSCISYGNAFINNADGFDYIIIHESGHEWWGNNITSNDIADMWIHESFTTYGESLFVECRKGYEAAVKYLISQRFQIEDKKPIVTQFGVNDKGSKYDNDMYYKGSWMIHTFRSTLNNDSLFFVLLKNIQVHFALQTIDGNELIEYINQYINQDYNSFFNQYLHFASQPILDLNIRKKKKNIIISYKWKTDVSNYNYPVEINIDNKIIRINSTNNWQSISYPIKNISTKKFDIQTIAANTDRFYVKTEVLKKMN